MTELEPISISPSPDQPRHPQQEIADLLAAALLRLRAHPVDATPSKTASAFALASAATSA
jgi:hypothetical protein